MRSLILILVLAGTSVWSYDYYDSPHFENDMDKILYDDDEGTENSKYQKTIEELKARHSEELDRLNNIINLQTLQISNFHVFHKEKNDRLNELNSTVDQLREQIRRDQDHYKSLAQQYQIAKDQATFFQNKLDSLVKVIDEKQAEMNVTEGNLNKEELKLNELIVRINKTIDDLKSHSIRDEANKYLASLSSWMRSDNEIVLMLVQCIESLLEGLELFTKQVQTVQDQKIRVFNEQKAGINITEWQRSVRNQSAIPQYNLTAGDSGQNMTLESVKKIAEWIKTELLHLKNEVKLEIEHLTVWQKFEKDRIVQLAQQLGNLSLIDFEEKLTSNRSHLEFLAKNYRISVQVIEEFIQKEAERLENEGIIGNLADWQKVERSRIYEILKRTSLTTEEFEDELNEDYGRLQDLANEYHTTVDDVEKWISEEAKRQINSKGSTSMLKPVPKTPEEHVSSWQENERENIFALVDNNHITKKTDFKKHLADDTTRIAKVAFQFQIPEEDIAEFLRNEYQQLLKLNLISEGEESFEIEQWQASEDHHTVLDLLQDPTYSWSYEKLANKIRNDKERLQQLVNLYEVTVNQIEELYTTELRKLLQKETLHSDNLTRWQKIEKSRLYTSIVLEKISIEKLKKHLLTDRTTFKDLAAKYEITLDELINWQFKELERLASLGYGKPTESGGLKNWQLGERKRLRTISRMVIITSRELLEFIKSDKLFQNALIKKYKVSPPELLKFQQKELQLMENEGLLEILHYCEGCDHWESLYNPDITDDKAIANVAKHYKMNVLLLEDLRNSELERLQMVAHKGYVTVAAYINWSKREVKRLNNLGTRTGLSGDKLDKWRRKLYLLVQGLIDLDLSEGGNRGIESFDLRIYMKGQ